MDPKVKDQLRKQFAKGVLFEGKYRIEGHIGTGSFAYVMLAKHEAMERRVALKVLKPDLVSANPELLERFVNEVKIVGRLKHPNTVTVFDYGRAKGDVHYLVMEYVEGVGLDEVLEEQGVLSPERVVSITQQILKSLAEAHAFGIVHRDLKPSNIMLTYSHDEKEIVKVLDFGVAKLVDNSAPSRSRKDNSVRRSTQFIGTPVYMSPEQVLGQDVFPASDLYSLGLIVYEMLVGESPFEGVGVAQIAQAHVDKGALPLKKLKQAPSQFRDLILRATSRNVEDRYADVGAFARALPSFAGPSGEFAMLMDESSVSEGDDFLDVFGGKNYIEAPPSEAFDDMEDDPFIAPTKKPSRASGPLRPAQPVRLNREEPVPKAPISSSMELDVGAVKRNELRHRREREHSAPTTQLLSGQDWGWLVGGIIGFPVSFIVASTVWSSGDGPDRWFLGFLPVVIAALWSQFAGVKRHHGSKLETLIVPFAQHMAFTALLLIAIACLTSAENATSKMSEGGAWFVQSIKSGSPMSPLKGLVEMLVSFLTTIFSFAARILPW